MSLRSLCFVACAMVALAGAPRHAGAAVADATALPYVHSIRTLPAQPCATVPTAIVLAGAFPSACGELLGHQGLTVNVRDPLLTCQGCPAVIVPWTDTLELGLLAAGTYRVVITMNVIDPCPVPDDTTVYRTEFTFTVAPGCTVPPPDPLVYVRDVRITPQRDSTTRIICPDDSIRVTVAGVFPDDCHILRRIDLLPSPIAGPLPEPPVVRLVFDNLCCLDRLCFSVPQPWRGDVTLPPLPGRSYNLMLEGVEVCCRDSVLPGDPRGTRLVPFTVVSAESCGTVPPLPVCLWPGWDHAHQTGGCDAFLDSQGAATVTFAIYSTVPLAGLQGAVHATDTRGQVAGLYVKSIVPVGPAAGMRITWEPDLAGARFVLFAEHGAPIPATDFGSPVNVLDITWGRVLTGEEGIIPDPARRWIVYASELLGADGAGGAVPLCAIRSDERVVTDVATICAGGLCDLNGDAVADVRDLVLMVHCLHGSGGCPPDPATALDCDGDGDFDLADVMCCARVVIGAPPCPNCPPDSMRVEPAIGLSFGTPARTASGIDIPVRIDGSDRIGAARFAFRMPGSLVGGASVRLADGGAWLPLEQREEGQLVFGLVSLVPTDATGSRGAWLDAVLHLDFAPGDDPRGQITLGEVEVSGRDGVLLAVDLGAPVVRLGPGVGLSLSPARPNPFRTSTELRLTLDAPAEVELGVYDLAGRRLASVHRGFLPVGVHRFTWDGRGDDGSRVAAGLYFLRASAPGASAVHKVVLVRE